MTKKKSNHSTTEIMIPNWDEPYKLPNNWIWINLGSVCILENGIKYDNEELVYWDAKTLRGVTEPQKRSSGRLVEKNQKVILVDGENSGEVFVVPYRGYLGSTFKIITVLDNVDEMYIRYFIDYNQDKLKKNKIGAAIPHLKKELFYGLEFPLAPIPEQKRIVEHIDLFFTKLDEAREKAQMVVDNFETRKRAILYRAFSGKLTEKWRCKNNISLDSWTQKRINQICVPRAGYAFDSKKFTNTGYQIIRMGNLYDGRLDLDKNPVFISEENVNDIILKKVLVNDGDILITLTGTKYKRDYGYAVCIPNPTNLLVNQRILCLSPDNSEITTNYFLYYLQSDLFRDVFFSNETGGVNQGNVSSKFVENIKINIPTYPEQEEIGRLIEGFLEKEKQAKELAEEVIQQVDSIKKSVFAKAFRGTLGTNDSSDESVLKLLKQLNREDGVRLKNDGVISKRISIPSEVKLLLSSVYEEDIIKLLMKSGPVPISNQEIMSLSSNKFELMDALRNLEKKNLIIKNEEKKYLLKR